MGNFVLTEVAKNRGQYRNQALVEMGIKQDQYILTKKVRLCKSYTGRYRRFLFPIAKVSNIKTNLSWE